MSLKGHFEGLCTRLSLSFAGEPIDKVNAQKSNSDFQQSVPLSLASICASSCGMLNFWELGLSFTIFDESFYHVDATTL